MKIGLSRFDLTDFLTIISLVALYSGSAFALVYFSGYRFPHDLLVSIGIGIAVQWFATLTDHHIA